MGNAKTEREKRRRARRKMEKAANLPPLSLSRRPNKACVSCGQFEAIGEVVVDGSTDHVDTCPVCTFGDSSAIDECVPVRR